MNTRKRLLKAQKVHPTDYRRDRIKILNHEIKNFYFGQKKQRVRRGLVPSNSKTLWDAVRIAMDLNVESIPNTMFSHNIEIQRTNLPDLFACFFNNKVNTIVESTNLFSHIFYTFMNEKRMVDTVRLKRLDW